MKSITLKKILISLSSVAFAVTLIGFISPVYASSIVFTGSGTSTLGNQVSFEADMNIASGVLTITLKNTSPNATAGPAELLSSFYFTITNSQGNAPTLTFTSAKGNVYAYQSGNWQYDSSVKDIGYNDGNNLKGGWDYKSFTPDGTLPYNFGIGTVGNSTNPNFDQNYTFSGADVNPADYSIYTGDITARSLQNQSPLVLDAATFTFDISGGTFTNADIKSVLFGLGTGPDSTISPTPEPATMLLFGTGLIGLAGLALKKIK